MGRPCSRSPRKAARGAWPPSASSPATPAGRPAPRLPDLRGLLRCDPGGTLSGRAESSRPLAPPLRPVPLTPPLPSAPRPLSVPHFPLRPLCLRQEAACDKQGKVNLSFLLATFWSHAVRPAHALAGGPPDSAAESVPMMGVFDYWSRSLQMRGFRRTGTHGVLRGGGAPVPEGGFPHGPGVDVSKCRPR